MTDRTPSNVMCDFRAWVKVDETKRQYDSDHFAYWLGCCAPVENSRIVRRDFWERYAGENDEDAGIR